MPARFVAIHSKEKCPLTLQYQANMYTYIAATANECMLISPSILARMQSRWFTAINVAM